MSEADLRLLLVEDSPADARLVRAYLAQVGTPFSFALTHVTTLAAAREALTGAVFDLVFCGHLEKRLAPDPVLIESG